MYYRMDNGMLVVRGKDFEAGSAVADRFESELVKINHRRQTIFVDKEISSDFLSDMFAEVLPEKEKWFDCLPETMLMEV